MREIFEVERGEEGAVSWQSGGSFDYALCAAFRMTEFGWAQDRAGFQPLWFLAGLTWGVAPGCYSGAPLVLRSLRVFRVSVKSWVYESFFCCWIADH